MSPRCTPGRLCEAETQTELLPLLSDIRHPLSQNEEAHAATTPSSGMLTSPPSGAFSTGRSSGYLSREPSLGRETNNNNNLLASSHRSGNNTSAASTPRMRRLPHFLPLEPVSPNGNTITTLSQLSSTCDCPGCPGNPRAGHRISCHPDTDDASNDVVLASGSNLEEPEDYLDTLDRKVTEMIVNRDSSRWSSFNDLAASKRTEDMYGPLSLSYGRKQSTAAGGGGADLNCNPTGGSRVPKGLIRFEEDDGKASSSEEAMDSSQEDLSQIWSDEDSDHYVLRRRR